MVSTHFRLEVHFSGRVQGVGFRYLTRQLAQGFAVTGRVRNLPDGRVHLVVEGTEEEARAFVSEVQAELKHYIKEAAEGTLDGPAQFRDFHIG